MYVKKNTPMKRKKPGLDRKAYRVHFDENSGLAQALHVIQQNTPDALHNLYTTNLKSFWKSFSNPAFKPSSMTNFSSGWNLSDMNYLEWAKNDKLSPAKFAREVNLPFMPTVPNKYLEAECRDRANLVNAISGLSMLESLAKKLKDSVTTHTAIEAISRHFLSVLSDTSLRWFLTKTDVRRIVLQGSRKPAAIDLLVSDMWEPRIFSKKAIKKLIESDVPQLGINVRLGIDEKGSKFSYRHPHRVTNKTFVKKQQSNRDNFQFFQRQHSPIRFGDDQNTTTNFFKGKHNQNKYNSWGTKNQKTGKQNQKTNKGNYSKSKPWNKSKQNLKNPGSSKGGKGNNNQQ